MPAEIKKVEYMGREFAIATKYARVSDDWLVFLHGIGCAKECFDEVFNSELARRFSILTFDFVGFGASSKPDDFSYTLEDHAEITKFLIEQFEPERVTFIAHSMGGSIGVLVAKDRENLASFVSLEGNLVSQDASLASRRTSEQTEDEFVSEGFNNFLDFLKNSDKPAFRKWAQWYGNSSRSAVYKSGRSLVEWSDSGKLLTYFNGLPKKAYVYGDKMNYDYLLNRLKHTEVIRIPNSGHFMMLDNPQAFCSSIDKIL